MTTDHANALIVTSLGVAGALIIVKDATTSTAPAARYWVGLTFAGLGLAVLAEEAPQLAGSLAVLVMVSSAFVYGGPAWAAITKATTPPKGGTSK